jgi:hypothetical protein
VVCVRIYIHFLASTRAVFTEEGALPAIAKIIRRNDVNNFLRANAALAISELAKHSKHCRNFRSINFSQKRID